MKILVLSLTVFLSCASILAQPTTLPQTIKQLRQIKTDDYDTRVPVAARPLLTQLKQQLFSLINETIQAQENQGKAPAQWRAIIVSKLAKVGIKLGYGKEDTRDTYIYGYIPAITFQHPPHNPNLLVVTTTIGVCCGEDTSLYVFQKQQRRWQLVVQHEANNYEEVSSANGRFRYAISPPDRNGRFFVVTARVNPWCTSNWQGLYYQVMRPSSQPASPQVLLSGHESIFLGMEDEKHSAYRLKLIGNTFSLRFDTDATKRETEDGYTYHHLTLRYEVQGDEVTLLRTETRLPK